MFVCAFNVKHMLMLLWTWFPIVSDYSTREFLAYHVSNYLPYIYAMRGKCPSLDWHNGFTLLVAKI